MDSEKFEQKLDRLRNKAMNLPLTPGVYLMKNSKSEIIYIGKAKALKNRVSQYFGSQNRHAEKVLRMVENVSDFDYILTDSEFEALTLECSLIKLHKPKYNILLKDDKGYSYIRITKGDWPKIDAVRKIGDDNALYLGPYTSSFTVTETVDEVKKIYKLPSCSKSFPRDIGKSRPCLNYFIKQCSAPCAGKISLKEYNNSVASALSFIKRGSSKTLQRMQEEMEEASENLEFERAARLRDRIKAIRTLQEKQKVVDSSVKDQDIFAIARSPELACMEVFRFENGRLYDKEEFIIDKIDNLEAARSELITSYYSLDRKAPPRITLDGEIQDEDLIKEWLRVKFGKKIGIHIPQKGEQAQLVEMCKTNASEKLAQATGRFTGKEMSSLDELAGLLGLSKPPERIEAYDISHTAGSENVAGMAVFKFGRPYKKAYRKFKIKSFEGQDDYGSMKEVIDRRLSRYFENEDDEGFGALPDLILLDGGHGQISAVKPILEKYNLSIPLFGMVKDNKHKTRAIAKDGGEIAINSSRKAFTLVSNIQDEVHRFAIEYHRNRRKKRAISSSLLEIDGIGEKRAKILLKRFKTITDIKAASVEELEKVEGISKTAANSVYAHFHPEEQIGSINDET